MLSTRKLNNIIPTRTMVSLSQLLTYSSRKQQVGISELFTYYMSCHLTKNNNKSIIHIFHMIQGYNHETTSGNKRIIRILKQVSLNQHHCTHLRGDEVKNSKEEEKSSQLTCTPAAETMTMTAVNSRDLRVSEIFNTSYIMLLLF